MYIVLIVVCNVEERQLLSGLIGFKRSPLVLRYEYDLFSHAMVFL